MIVQFPSPLNRKPPANCSGGAFGHRHHAAAGILPAVEGGILPPGPALEFSSTVAWRTVNPPGETPGSTAGKMPAAGLQARANWARLCCLTMWI